MSKIDAPKFLGIDVGVTFFALIFGIATGNLLAFGGAGFAALAGIIYLSDRLYRNQKKELSGKL